MTEQRTLGPKLFKIGEAEALLPFIKERLGMFQSLYVEYENTKRDLAVLRLVSSSGGDEGNPDFSALSEKENEIANLMRQLRSIQQELTESGCVPKSLQDGLVDFFALKDGRLVFLCWKQGEGGIRAWHTLEGGFSGRMPIASFSKRTSDAAGDET